jgi:hypothetical protein
MEMAESEDINEVITSGDAGSTDELEGFGLPEEWERERSFLRRLASREEDGIGVSALVTVGCCSA